MRASLPSAAACLLGLGLAACGAANSHAVSSTGDVTTATSVSIGAPAPAPATTATTTPTPTPTAVTVSTQTITAPSSGGAGLTSANPPASAACVGAELQAAAVPPNGATGNVVLGFTLTNTSSTPCRSYGWPGVAFLDASGGVADSRTHRSTQDILGPTPAHAVTIAPGALASFRVTVRDTNSQGGESGCGSYGLVQIIAPDDTTTLRVSLPNGPVTVCGTAEVSPLASGRLGTGL